MAVKTIVLKGNPERIEVTATAVAITPGFLLEKTSAGTIQAHSTTGGNCAPYFAEENALQGDEIGDDYAVSAQIQVAVGYPGCEFYAWLATSQNVAIGDLLEPGGAGLLREHTVPVASSDGTLDEGGETLYFNAPRFEALEAVVTTGAAARIKVRQIA